MAGRGGGCLTYQPVPSTVPTPVFVSRYSLVQIGFLSNFLSILIQVGTVGYILMDCFSLLQVGTVGNRKKYRQRIHTELSV